MITVESNWKYQGNIEDDLEMEVGRRANAVLNKLGRLMQRRIRQKLNQHGSGVMYGDHQASAPGEPPAPKTGDYADSIDVDVVIFKYVYRLWFRSRFWQVFGRRLELGGSGGGAYIAPRPHIRPVFEQSANEMQLELDDM